MGALTLSQAESGTETLVPHRMPDEDADGSVPVVRAVHPHVADRAID